MGAPIHVRSLSISTYKNLIWQSRDLCAESALVTLPFCNLRICASRRTRVRGNTRFNSALRHSLTTVTLRGKFHHFLPKLNATVLGGAFQKYRPRSSDRVLQPSVHCLDQHAHRFRANFPEAAIPLYIGL